ncbi:MAG: hypothetical protein QW702_08765 [Candidatus Bathyarchaeia archaeon]
MRKLLLALSVMLLCLSIFAINVYAYDNIFSKSILNTTTDRCFALDKSYTSWKFTIKVQKLVWNVTDYNAIGIAVTNSTSAPDLTITLNLGSSKDFWVDVWDGADHNTIASGSYEEGDEFVFVYDGSKLSVSQNNKDLVSRYGIGLGYTANYVKIGRSIGSANNPISDGSVFVSITQPDVTYVFTDLVLALVPIIALAIMIMALERALKKLKL